MLHLSIYFNILPKRVPNLLDKSVSILRRLMQCQAMAMLLDTTGFCMIVSTSLQTFGRVVNRVVFDSRAYLSSSQTCATDEDDIYIWVFSNWNRCILSKSFLSIVDIRYHDITSHDFTLIDLTATLATSESWMRLKDDSLVTVKSPWEWM